jgi:hypothetical protein
MAGLTMLAVSVRHRYLASLTSEARLELFNVERWMRTIAQDRDCALSEWGPDRFRHLALASASPDGKTPRISNTRDAECDPRAVVGTYISAE